MFQGEYRRIAKAMGTRNPIRVERKTCCRHETVQGVGLMQGGEVIS